MGDDDLLADDLEAFLAGNENQWPPDYVTRGDEAELATANLDDAANWTLRRIARARRELARIERTAAAERRRIDAWQADRSAGPLRLIEAEEVNLEAITRELVEMNPKRKTINLPNGKVSLKAPGQPSLVYDDEAELVAWLEANKPELLTVRTVKTAPKAAIKEWVKARDMSGDEAEGADPSLRLSWLIDPETGEQIPGAHAERPIRDRFSYETDTPPA